MTRVCMGGTFDVFHRGHEVLLERAFEAGDEEVFVGVTTDRFAGSTRTRPLRPWSERAESVRAFLERRGWLARAVIAPIDDPVGRGLEPRYDAIAVTAETVRGAERIAKARRRAGAPPLRVVRSPIVLAEDGGRVSATRIRAGEIDVAGKLTERVRVAVGSANAAKVEAVRSFVSTLHPDPDVRGFDVPSGAPEQPWGDETWRGAAARAAAAFAEWPEAHFAVGIEAGVAESPAGLLDFQVAVVLDRGDRATAGQGASFPHPPAIEDAVREGRSVGEAVRELAGTEAVPEDGAIGFLSWGLLDRRALSEQALLAAWLPRLRPGLYGIDLKDA